MSPFAGFVNPAMAWGALFATVPLVIHLFNRRRHRTLQWGAMRFVLEAYRKTRRRAQIENLLLLFLRMAAVGLLAFAIARPFTDADSALAPLTTSRRDVVVVLDSSASVGYRESVQSVHERILERARKLFGELDGARGDRVRLIQAAGVATLMGGRSPEEATAVLATMTRPKDEALDLAAAMAEVVKLAEENALGTGSSLLEVRLLTDLQRRSFLPDLTQEQPDQVPAPNPAPNSAPNRGKSLAESATNSASTSASTTGGRVGDSMGADLGVPEAAPLQRALDRLDQLGVRVIVEDLGPPVLVPANLGLVSIEPVTEGLGVDMTTDFGVTVRNWGEQPRNTRVALSVDGDRLPSQRVDLAGRSSQQVVFPITFRSSGDHALEARLEGDPLPADDRRALVVHIPDPIEVLLVDGDPRDEIDRDETGILQAVLEPLDGDGLQRGSAPFRATTLTLAALADGAAIDNADVIVLANVDNLAPSLIERLEKRISGGAALIITAGDRMGRPGAIEIWNTRFWRPDGTGLLPRRLRGLVDSPDHRTSWFRVADFAGDHPTLSFFADERWQPFLTEVPIYTFLQTEDAPADSAGPSTRPSTGESDPGVSASGSSPGASPGSSPLPGAGSRVLASLDDPQSSPLLIARDYGRGRVLLWTSSLDGDWNRFPDLPSAFIPLWHELVRWAGAGPEQTRNLSVGENLVAEVSGFPRDPVLVRPDGTRRPLDGAAEPVSGDAWRLPATPRSDEAGLWHIEGSGFESIPFAVCLDPFEGDLTRLTIDELESLSPVFQAWTPEQGERDPGQARSASDGELWRWLAGLALLALILETFWSAWVSRQRSLA